jgi:thiamine-phosphate pyrophosphorylase
VVAIGGLNAGNVGECVAAGCAGVAVVSAIFGVGSPAEAAQEIRSVVDSCRPPP